MQYKFLIEDQEYWWGGIATDGEYSPFDKDTNLLRNLTTDPENQSMPMLISSTGRCIWSEKPFKFEIKNGIIEIDGEDVETETFGTTLRDAYVGAMKKYFPPMGEKLKEDFFKIPQYNTWMQMTYYQTQEGVLDYAKSIIENGFKPGILMIDEGWQKEYGNWSFDTIKFPDAKGMVDKLHQMGFKVMVWVTPYVRPDGLDFMKHTFEPLCPDKYDQYFMRNKDGEVSITKWWNGYSAILDFTKECDCEYMDSQLQKLMSEVGIDGFKFDGGLVSSYNTESVVNGEPETSATAAERNIAWNDFGAKYTYHEYKDTFKGGGKRVVQRIRDRAHSWNGEGLNTLIPNALMQGILGYPFVCPDMIGGGEWTIRELNQEIDQELFVRMAQCSVFFPMMQFSWAPWEAVDREHLALIKKAHDMHIEFSDTILELVEDAYKTGEPIIRLLEYNYPHCGYEKIRDEFMLGEKLLIAPVITKGETIRTIQLPKGSWKGFDGKIYDGGCELKVPVTLADIPYFEKLD